MNPADLERVLSGLPIGEVRYLPTTGSTNDEALAWARQGAPDLALVAAGEQTAGRGRAGRRWKTPPGTALAFSLGLRLTRQEEAYFSRLAGLGALAVCDALAQQFRLQAEIKWPNDILVEGRKLAGILVDALWEGEQPAWAVLGIGLNVTPGSVDPTVLPPGELLLPATCLEAELGRDVDQAPLLGLILARILAWRPRLVSPGFMRAWEERLAYLGCRVQVLTGTGEVEIEGAVLGLASDGALRLLQTGGTELALRVGDVRLRACPPPGLSGE